MAEGGGAEQALLLVLSYPNHRQGPRQLELAQQHAEACVGAEGCALELWPEDGGVRPAGGEEGALQAERRLQTQGHPAMRARGRGEVRSHTRAGSAGGVTAAKTRARRWKEGGHIVRKLKYMVVKMAGRTRRHTTMEKRTRPRGRGGLERAGAGQPMQPAQPWNPLPVDSEWAAWVAAFEGPVRRRGKRRGGRQLRGGDRSKEGGWGGGKERGGQEAGAGAKHQVDAVTTVGEHALLSLVAYCFRSI